MTHGFYLVVEEVDYLWGWTVESSEYIEDEGFLPLAEPLPPPPTVTDIDKGLDWDNWWDWQNVLPSPMDYYLEHKDDYVGFTDDYINDEEQYKYNDNEGYDDYFDWYASFFYYNDAVDEELVLDEENEDCVDCDDTDNLQDNFWDDMYELNDIRIMYF